MTEPIAVDPLPFKDLLLALLAKQNCELQTRLAQQDVRAALIAAGLDPEASYTVDAATSTVTRVTP